MGFSPRGTFFLDLPFGSPPFSAACLAHADALGASLTAALETASKTGAQHLNGLPVVQPHRHRCKLRLNFHGVEGLVLEQHTAAHHHLKAHNPPLVVGNVGLLYHDPSAFIQPAQDPPAKIHTAPQMTPQTPYTL